MIRSVRVSNYRSLGENIVVRFSPMTVLVGPNGSGKSNVLDALLFVSDAMHSNLSAAITDRHGITAVRRWSAGHPYNVLIAIDLLLDGRPANYSFELVGDEAEEYRVKSEEAVVSGEDGDGHRFRVEKGRWIVGPTGLRPPVDDLSLALPMVGGDARFRPLFGALRNLAAYSIFPDTLRVPQKYNAVKPMSRHGENWVSILKDQPAGTWKPELIEALRKLTGDAEDIRVSPAAGYLVAEFRHHTLAGHRPKWFDAAQESDGTLRVAGIVTALVQEPPPPFIGVEEPELTVHPGALPLLYDYLTQAAGRSQVVVTTHSPDLLNLVDARSVRVVQRSGGITTVAPMQERQRELVLSGLMTLGELMLSEGLQQQDLLSPHGDEP
jgi:predicted ATPase